MKIFDIIWKMGVFGILCFIYYEVKEIYIPTAGGIWGEHDGGQGGVVCTVTSTADSGSGSLRECVDGADGPRWIRFAVDGEISLSSSIRLPGRSERTMAMAKWSPMAT